MAKPYAPSLPPYVKHKPDPWLQPQSYTIASQSILEDSTFRTLLEALSPIRDSNAWLLLVGYQDCPDPQLLLKHDSFASSVRQSEPGQHFNFAGLRGDVMQCQNWLVLEEEDKPALFKKADDIFNTHMCYVRTMTAFLAYTMYDKLIDRCYGVIKDENFRSFFMSQVPQGQQYYWPSYRNVKQLNDHNLQNARQEYQNAHTAIDFLKSQDSFISFTTNVQKALDVRSGRLKPDRSLTGPPPLGPSIARPALLPCQRKALIKKRNTSQNEAREQRNERLKQYNMNNVHQWGSQGRVCVSDSVIQALVGIQGGHMEELLPSDDEDEKGKDDDDEEGEKFPKMIIPDGFVNLNAMPGGIMGNGG